MGSADLFFSGEQFFSNKLLLHVHRRTSKGRLHGTKMRGYFTSPSPPLRHFGALLCAEMWRIGGVTRVVKGVGR